VIESPPGNHVLRLATKPDVAFPNHNTATYDLTDLGLFDQVVADFDLRITPTRASSPPTASALPYQHGRLQHHRASAAVGRANFPARSPSVGHLQNAGEVGANHVSVHLAARN
jgi:hypothetical protein